jgi:hypothetical protein
MPRFQVTVEGGCFEIEADDEEDAIDTARDDVPITADLIEEDEDDDGDDEEDEEDEEDEQITEKESR